MKRLTISSGYNVKVTTVVIDQTGAQVGSPKKRTLRVPSKSKALSEAKGLNDILTERGYCESVIEMRARLERHRQPWDKRSPERLAREEP